MTSKIYYVISIVMLAAGTLILIVFKDFSAATFSVACAIYVRMIADKEESIENLKAMSAMKNAGFEGLFIMRNDEEGDKK